VSPDDPSVTYTKRIDELILRLSGTTAVDRSIAEGCFAGTLTIFEAIYGGGSQQTKSLLEVRKSFSKTPYSSTYEVLSLAGALRGMLMNVKEEIQLGLVRSIANEAAGVVIGDLVGLARAQLREGYKDVAAVLASAALEDALKRKAHELGINPEGKSLDVVINALKAKGFLKGAQAGIVSSYTKLRNAAMHADWAKIDSADVGALLGFLEPFLTEHFT
jgi:hypothetical protein